MKYIPSDSSDFSTFNDSSFFINGNCRNLHNPIVLILFLAIKCIRIIGQIFTVQTKSNYMFDYYISVYYFKAREQFLLVIWYLFGIS